MLLLWFSIGVCACAECEKILGKETRGYDPSQDIVWLRSEIVRWVQGNLMEKWYFSSLSEKYFQLLI
jgi:ribosome-binding ATPase YchF (GTP1/OBG family)